MLKIGDYAHHQTTGQVGQVVAYGHQVLDGVYQTTLESANERQQGSYPSQHIYRRCLLGMGTSK